MEPQSPIYAPPPGEMAPPQNFAPAPGPQESAFKKVLKKVPHPHILCLKAVVGISCCGEQQRYISRHILIVHSAAESHIWAMAGPKFGKDNAACKQRHNWKGCS